MKVTSNEFLGIKSVEILDLEYNDITFSKKDDSGFFIESWSEELNPESHMHAFGILGRVEMVEFLSSIVHTFGLREDFMKALEALENESI